MSFYISDMNLDLAFLASWSSWAWCLQMPLLKLGVIALRSPSLACHCCCCLAELFATSPTSAGTLLGRFAEQKLRKQVPVRSAGRPRHTLGVQPFFIVDKTWRDLTRTPAQPAWPSQRERETKNVQVENQQSGFYFSTYETCLNRNVFRWTLKRCPDNFSIPLIYF